MAPGSRYQVVHETRYRYSSTVTSSRQLAHLAPRNTAWQDVHSHRVEITPAPSERTEGGDYFGNGVLRFVVDQPHDELLVRSDSVVTVSPYADDAFAGMVPWEIAQAEPDSIGKPVDLEIEQYRVASPMTPIMEAATEYAGPSFPPGRGWREGMLDLTRRIRHDFVYDPKATTVTTRVAEVLQHRRGVCQDFAHLMITCVRSLGLPARYVSGYVLNRAPKSEDRLVGADASHAWVASHCPGLGWVAFDPTNGKLAGIEFVTLGWGREFSDVTPLRGVVLGAATQTLSVAVTVQRV